MEVLGIGEPPCKGASVSTQFHYSAFYFDYTINLYADLLLRFINLAAPLKRRYPLSAIENKEEKKKQMKLLLSRVDEEEN